MPPPPRLQPTSPVRPHTITPTYASVVRSNSAPGASSSSIDPPSQADHTQLGEPPTTFEDVERSDALDDIAPNTATAPRDIPHPWRRVGSGGLLEDLSPIDPELDLGYEQTPLLPRPAPTNTLAPYVSLDEVLDETAEGLPAPIALDTSSIPAPAPRSPISLATRTIAPTRSFRNLIPRAPSFVDSLTEEASALAPLARSFASLTRPMTRASQDERIWRRYDPDQSSRPNPYRRRGGDDVTDEEEIDDESGSDNDDIAMDVGSEEDSDAETLMMEQDAQALLQAVRRRRRLAAESGPRFGRRAMENRANAVGAGEELIRSLRRSAQGSNNAQDLGGMVSDTIVGGSGGMLRRGQNNRRRLSTMRRNVEDVVLPDAALRSSGLRPTNDGESVQPTLVRTVALAEDGAKPGHGHRGEPRSKRRKLDPPSTSNQASTPTLPPPTYRSYNPHNASLSFPTRFIDSKAFRVTVKPYATPTHPHRHCVTFNFKVPEIDPDSYAQSVRTDRTVPVQCGVYYYEVEVLDAGESGYMSVGWMRKGLKMNRLVGWDQGSWGWHGDDGMAFGGHGKGDPFGPSWTKGDVIGCGLDFTTRRAFFTKNGEMVGHVFSNLWAGLCPAVGLRTMGESLAVDFNGPFKFDIDNYVRNLRDIAWREALKPSSPLGHSGEASSTAKGTSQSKNTAQEKTISPLSLHLDPEVDLPPQSRLHDSAEKTSAAWVLDYLRQEGHVSTHAILRNTMAERKWLNVPKSPTASLPDPELDNDKVSPDDFTTREKCCTWLEKRLLDSATKRFPYAMLETILPEDKLPLVKIHQYLSLLRQAHTTRRSQSDALDPAGSPTSASTRSGAAVVDLDMEALHWGQRCVKESTSWPEEERDLMSSSTGLMGLSPDTWPENGVGGKDQRGNDTEKIMSAVRDELGVKAESHLSKDVRSTMARLSILSTVQPKAGFIDMTRFLRDPEAYYMLCRRHRKKDSAATTGDSTAMISQSTSGLESHEIRGEEEGVKNEPMES